MSAVTCFSHGADSWSIAVHGGAGNAPSSPGEARERGCALAVEAGAEVLARGGRALDAVQRAVEVLEDDPLFNAGTGGSLTLDGRLELDAALMDGRSLAAGAVCALGPFRNPIRVARLALEDGRHLLYAAEGANAFARQHGLAPEEPEAMITPAARTRLAQALASPSPSPASPSDGGSTVGAVARDRHGDLAAATSTGGTVGKNPGRIGDSPIVGAGTYAENQLGAISATGHGEGILRVVLASRLLLTRDFWHDQDPARAAQAALTFMLERTGSTGGLILATPEGALTAVRTTGHMTWAALSASRSLATGT